MIQNDDSISFKDGGDDFENIPPRSINEKNNNEISRRPFWLGMFGGALITILVLGSAVAAVYKNRFSIIGKLFDQYVLREINVQNNGSMTSIGALANQSITESVIAKADPAVVSIIISKKVPVLQQYYENFDIPGLPNVQVPDALERGTVDKEIGGGTGFFVNSKGLIVTNKHVVDDNKATYAVYTKDGKKYDAKVVAKDPSFDIAVLKINGENFSYLSFSDSDKLRLGQSVIAIGNALGEFSNTVSQGIVSGLSRSIVASDMFGNEETLDEVIQTDAAINLGNSGGPLLDLSGRVIGVNVAVVAGSENIGFALPANTVKNIVESVEKSGKITRPLLGVRYVQITPEIQTDNALPVNYGVWVKSDESKTLPAVEPGSSADMAGIVENDIIIEVDRVPLKDGKSLVTVIRNKKVGDNVELKVLRGGKEITVTAKLQQAMDGP